MDEELIEKLNLNMRNIQEVEENIAIVNLKIFEKRKKDLKKIKTEELKRILEEEASFLNQDSEDFKEYIDPILKKNSLEFERLCMAYDDFFDLVFKMMENAILNENIAIVNMIKIKKKLEAPGKSEQEYKELYKVLVATAQRKINYSLIVDGCKDKLKWCVNHFEVDVKKVFEYKVNNQLALPSRLIDKIKKYFLDKLTGNRKYRVYLQEYRRFNMKRIEKKNKRKIMNLMSSLKGIREQIKFLRYGISIEYNKGI